jgi:hypothetical protein
MKLLQTGTILPFRTLGSANIFSKLNDIKQGFLSDSHPSDADDNSSVGHDFYLIYLSDTIDLVGRSCSHCVIYNSNLYLPLLQVKQYLQSD